MKPEDLLQSVRRQQKAEKSTMRFARTVIVLFSVVMRCLELFGSPKRRQRRQQFREQLQALKSEETALLDKIKNSKGFEGIEAVYEFQKQHSRPEDDQELAVNYAGFRAMRQESETLCDIRQNAGKDLAAAVQGYREYITSHPESSSAYSYLAGVLQQTGDLEDSLRQYHEALRLAKSGSIRRASVRL